MKKYHLETAEQEGGAVLSSSQAQLYNVIRSVEVMGGSHIR